MMQPQPSWRKPAGVFMIIGLIIIWSVLIGSLSSWIGRLHFAVQAAIYVVAGIVWILPLRPLLIWMETGRWRA